MSKSVLILGAGSSSHYDFPLGGQLLENMKSLLGTKDGVDRKILLLLGYEENVIVKFYKALFTTARNTIDTFLNNKPEFLQIGKDTIALLLLQRENDWALRGGQNNWYKLFLQRMYDNGFSLILNDKLKVVTYNYDRSFEHYIYSTVKNDYDETTALNIINKLDVTHIHGSLGDLNHTLHNDLNRIVQYGSHEGIDYNKETSFTEIAGLVLKTRNFFKTAFESTDAIGLKYNLEYHFEGAEKVIFLGFGYDLNNLKLLPLQKLKHPEYIFGTAIGKPETEQKELQNVFRKLYNKNISFFDNDCYEFLTKNNFF